MRFALTTLLACTVAAFTRPAAAEVRINEICASNGTLLADGDGEFPDWIELYNSGFELVDLGGWGLSDDPLGPFKWVFPAGAVIAAGDRLVVFASGKDRRVSPGWKFDPGWAATLSDAAGIWRFDETEGNSVADSTANLNHGALVGGRRINLGLCRALAFQWLPGEHVSIPNSPALQTIGSMAIAMWLNPATLGRRQNPWNKAYGGEGTIVLEPNGILNFIWGTAGADGVPFQGFGSQVPLAANEWTHVAIVRDLTAARLRWYINGVEVASGAASYASAVASTAPLRIGTGYAGGFDGMIALPLLLPYAPGGAEISALYENTRGALQERLHTNFSLRAEGEPLQLTRPDGSVADALPAVALRRDLSYGRAGDGAESLLVFDRPTPFSPNAADGYLGILAEPKFSVEGGFYQNPFDLVLSAEPGVEILYTLDGSGPAEARLSGETYDFKSTYPQNPGDPFGEMRQGEMHTRSYDQALEVADRTAEPNRLTEIATWFGRSARAPAGNLRKATVVRARAVKPGYLSSHAASHSYFVGPDVETRFDLPVISLTTDDANLFDYVKGIYVPGKLADDWRTGAPYYSPPAWAIAANYWQQGKEWERPLHFEYFSPGGDRLLAKNLGVRTHGGASRTAYRKSLRLYARNRYEDGEMAHAFFPGLERKAFPGQEISSFDRIILRNSGNDSTGTLFLDALLQGLVAHLPIDTQAWQPALHYLNGESWGLINFRERQDGYFIEDHYGVPPEKSAILGSWTASLEDGDPRGQGQYRALVTYADANDAADPAVWSELVSKIDVANHALYHAYEIYIAHFDWPHNNIRFWKKMTDSYEPDAPYGQDGRWRWMIVDTDLGFIPSNAAHDSLRRIAAPAPGSAEHGSTALFRALMKNPEYQRLLINSLADLMNSSFAPQRVAAKVDGSNALLAHSRAEHFQRWQSSGTIDSGQGYKDFAAQRPGYVRQHVLDYFGLAGTYPLTLDCPHPERGSIRVNTLTVDQSLPGQPNPSAPYPWTGSYFQGVAVELEALPKPGYRFVGWQDQPQESPARIEFSAGGPATFTALFEAIPQPLVIHQWDFETEPFTSPSLTPGGGSLTAELTDAAAWQRNAADANLTSPHLRVNNPLGATLTFGLPSSGFGTISLDFDTRRSGQGAGQQTLSYTLDGSHWLEMETYAMIDAAAQVRRFDFSAMAEADDNPNFAVRINFSLSPEQAATGTGSAGNNRFDNVTLRGFPLPGTNLPPQVVAPVGRHEWVAAAMPLVIDLAAVFDDPDAGDSLVYTVVVAPPSVATGQITGDDLRLSGLVAGNAVVILSASDGVNTPVQTAFDLLVQPAAHAVAAADYLWRAWSPQAPAGTFPPNMIFLQGEGNNDSALDTLLTRSYEIPTADAALPGDVALPYAASSRTRINGLQGGGVGFTNTGRGRDLGSAVLALDTRGVDQVWVSWLAGTLQPNNRDYALRLQVRDGIAEAFQDLLVDGLPLEFASNAVAGHQQEFGPVALPAEWLGKAYVQLQWRYHQLSGTSGARAQLALDDVVVTSGDGPRAYESWRLHEYPDPSERDDDAVSGPLAESAGVKNLLRYALGLGRNESAVGALPVLNADGKLRFHCDPAKRDVVYRIASSPDLADWSEVIYDSSRDAEPIPVDGTLSLPVAMEGETRRFYRLEVVR